MPIKFGPAGIGSIKESESVLEVYKAKGIRAAEIPFTYQIFIKKDEDAVRIGRAAKKLGIQLSIHSPYWSNLNSDDPKKVEATKQRILGCCKIGEKLGAKRVVFHAGYYGKDREIAYNNIKARIIELMGEIKKNKWKIKIAPETMGKVNVFGSIEEISNLVKDTGCSFCLDFAHVLAREKKIAWKKIKKLFPQKEWHVHFSGIIYGEKGEKHHKKTPRSELKKLISNLPSTKNITIINESPYPVEDSLLGLKILDDKH